MSVRCCPISVTNIGLDIAPMLKRVSPYILVIITPQYSANINHGIHAILAERRVLLGTIRSAIAENPMLYANLTTLSFIEPEYNCRLKFYIAGIGNFAFLCEKIAEIIKKFCSHNKKNVAVAESHFMTITNCSILYATVKMLFYAESVGVVTSGRVTKMAVMPFDPQFPKTPCYAQTSRLYIFYRTGVIAD